MSNPFEVGSIRTVPVGTAVRCRVDGKYLVVADGASLPHRCIKTNQPVDSDDMQTVTVSYCSPVMALLIFLSAFLLLIVFLLARRRIYVNVGLTKEVRQKLRRGKIANTVVAIVIFLALPFSGAMGSDVMMLVALGLFIASVVYLIFGHRTVAAAKYRNGEYWLTGVSREFLAELATET